MNRKIKSLVNLVKGFEETENVTSIKVERWFKETIAVSFKQKKGPFTLHGYLYI